MTAIPAPKPRPKPNLVRNSSASTDEQSLIVVATVAIVVGQAVVVVGHDIE